MTALQRRHQDRPSIPVVGKPSLTSVGTASMFATQKCSSLLHGEDFVLFHHLLTFPSFGAWHQAISECRQ